MESCTLLGNLTPVALLCCKSLSLSLSLCLSVNKLIEVEVFSAADAAC